MAVNTEGPRACILLNAIFHIPLSSLPKRMEQTGIRDHRTVRGRDIDLSAACRPPIAVGAAASVLANLFGSHKRGLTLRHRGVSLPSLTHSYMDRVLL